MQVCLPAGCIDAIRVSLVDPCTDLPIFGLNHGYVFNCFTGLELTTNISEGDETVLRNSCGKKCFQTRKPDELTNIGVAFTLLNPDYELTNLLTGQPLLHDGLESIGWYQKEGLTHSPYVCVELFEQVPDEACTGGHRYRRIVIPKVRFKLPSNGSEDPFRIIPFEGLSSARAIAGYGDGPFHDSPLDFSALAGIETHYIEFFDDTLTDTLEGNCGFLAVEDVNFSPQPESFFSTAYPDMVGIFADPSSQAMLTEQAAGYPSGGYCGPMGVGYTCGNDKLLFWTTAFTYFDPANNPPAKVDLITDTGTHADIPLEDYYSNHFTVSMARISNASSYGTHIHTVVFKDAGGAVLCALDEPYGTWNGAEWLIGDPICSGAVQTAPQITTVTVTP